MQSTLLNGPSAFFQIIIISCLFQSYYPIYIRPTLSNSTRPNLGRREILKEIHFSIPIYRSWHSNEMNFWFNISIHPGTLGSNTLLNLDFYSIWTKPNKFLINFSSIETKADTQHTEHYHHDHHRQHCRLGHQ